MDYLRITRWSWQITLREQTRLLSTCVSYSIGDKRRFSSCQNEDLVLAESFLEFTL